MTNPLSEVQARITAAAKSAARNENSITLLAVSKKQSIEKINALYALGQRDFGENYVQEGKEKCRLLADKPIIWHFIGPIQSNKTRDIAEHFDWVHSVDRLKIAERLNNQRPDNFAPLNVCVQVNIDDEFSKSGVSEQQLPELIRSIQALPKLSLRGLMAIPRKQANPADSEPAFAKMQSLFQHYKKTLELKAFDTLSMGMSADLEVAIQQGATMVRVGTALFGKRPS